MEPQSIQLGKRGSLILGPVLSGIAVALAVSALVVSFAIPGPMGNQGGTQPNSGPPYMETALSRAGVG